MSERVTVREPDIYGPHSRASFFHDLVMAETKSDWQAAERLKRHSDHEAPIREARAARAREQFEASLPSGYDPVTGRAVPAEVEYRATDTDAGSGGELALPLWLPAAFAAPVRAGKPLADLIGSLPLPAGCHSIHVPVMTEGALARTQYQEAEALTSQDITTSAVTSTVCTIGGFVDVSQQLQDQTPDGFDAYCFPALMRSYNASLEQQILFGTGAANSLLGVTNTVGIPTANVVAGSALTSFQDQWVGMAQAAANVGNNRLLPPEAWLLAPRRWFWMAAQVDGQQRPFVLPKPHHPANNVPPAGGVEPVNLMGLPAYMDGAIPAGANADSVIACRPSDYLLWESADKAMVTVEPGSGSLMVRIVLARYVAFIAGRYPSGIGVVADLPVPSGY